MAMMPSRDIGRSQNGFSSAFGRGGNLALLKKETIVEQFSIQLNHPTFPVQEQAVNELISLALRVAHNQRGEDHLQSFTDVRFKLLREVHEFALAEGFYNECAELADITYYSVQAFAQDNDEQLMHQTIQHFADLIELSEERAFAVALAKYHTRASAPNNKNEVSEHAAIVALFRKERAE